MTQKIKNVWKKFVAKIDKLLTKLGSDLVTRPIFGAVVIIVTYFMLDDALMSKYDEAPDSLLYLGVMYAIAFLFIVHIRRIEYKTKKIKRIAYAMTACIGLSLLAIIFFYEDIIAIVFSTLYRGYPKSQVVLICMIAPILEELAYRYLLYDKWAKQKWGMWKGVLLIGFIFVLMHPINNMSGLALYWLPTALFFMAYNEMGLYWSITIHIIFNVIALL